MGSFPKKHELAINCLYTGFLQPVNVAKVLIQVGYEPLTPVYNGPTLMFFSGGFYYPNIFKYMKYLKNREGTYLVLYRGLVPRLGGVIVSNTVRNEVLGLIPKSETKCPPEQVLCEVGRQCAATAAAVIASHPFLVITNRMIVAIIGSEDRYSSAMSAVGSILSDQGVLGFYAGIIPHLICEVSGRALEVLLDEVYMKCDLNKRLGLPFDSKPALPVSSLHSFLSYPLQLTTTIMTVNNCGLAVSELPAMEGTSSGMLGCLSSLWKTGCMKRGSNLMFMRKAPMPAPEPKGDEAVKEE